MGDPNKTRELIADIENYLKQNSDDLANCHLLIESIKQLAVKDREIKQLKERINNFIVDLR